MKILILSGSPRKDGNTDILVEAFVKGASQKHNVEVVSVHDYHVNPCKGCIKDGDAVKEAYELGKSI